MILNALCILCTSFLLSVVALSEALCERASLSGVLMEARANVLCRLEPVF